MMGFFTNVVALLFLVSFCCGQLTDIVSFTNTENTVENCGSLELKWEGGTGPYTLSIIEAALLNAQTLQTFNPTTGTSLVWDVKVPANANLVRARISDSKGVNALKNFRVTTGTNRDCLAASSTTTPASSTTTSESTTTSSSSSTTTTTSSSSTDGILVTQAPTTTLPAATTPPPTTTETIVSTQLPAPSPAGNNQQQQSGATAKIGNLPVIAVVGIAVGGAIVLIALITLIFCYVRRVRAKSDSLDSWDGGYDPNSVYKATQNNEAVDFSVQPTYQAPYGQPGYMPYGEKAAGQYY